MPEYLCLWNLSRQAHRELRKFCVPELEAALADLQITPPQTQAFHGTDGSGSDAVAQQIKLSHESHIEPLPISGGDNERSLLPLCAAGQPGTDCREGQGSCNCLLHLADFEDDAVAKKALQQCILLTAIIEVS